MKIAVGCKVTLKPVTPLYNNLIGKVGEIVSNHPDLEIVTVKFADDDVTVKARYDWIEPIDAKPEIPDGAKTITKDEFIAAANTATAPDNYSRSSALEIDPRMFLMAISAFCIVSNAAERMFINDEPITVTRDDLVNFLWYECSPDSILKSTEATINAYDSLKLAMAAVPAIRTIVDILFPDVGNDD